MSVGDDALGPITERVKADIRKEAVQALVTELLRDHAAAMKFAAAAGEFLLCLSRARAKAPKLTAMCEEALDTCLAYAGFVAKKVREVRGDAPGKAAGE